MYMSLVCVSHFPDKLGTGGGFDDVSWDRWGGVEGLDWRKVRVWGYRVRMWRDVKVLAWYKRIKTLGTDFFPPVTLAFTQYDKIFLFLENLMPWKTLTYEALAWHPSSLKFLCFLIWYLAELSNENSITKRCLWPLVRDMWSSNKCALGRSPGPGSNPAFLRCQLTLCWDFYASSFTVPLAPAIDAKGDLGSLLQRKGRTWCGWVSTKLALTTGLKRCFLPSHELQT